MLSRTRSWRSLIRSLALIVVLACISCGKATPSSSGDAGPSPSQGSGTSPTDFAAMEVDGALLSDASHVYVDAGVDAASSYDRSTLAGCWTDAKCTRALLDAHGGDWTLADPAYGTTSAFDKALANGADAIKADLRFSKDGVPVVVHSSPFQAYELDPLSFDCDGKSVENLDVSTIVGCKWINGDHIQRLDDLLAWAKGNIVVMLCVKVGTTVPQSIAALNTLGATSYAFLELTMGMMATVPSAPGNTTVNYLVEAASQADVTTLLALNNPRVFMIEDANEDNFGGMAASAVTTMIDSQIHPAGKKAFTSVTSASATSADHTALWNQGFDVVMSNSYSAGYTARIAVNTARGISPP